MLIRRPILDGIKAGTVKFAFRRWRRPTVKDGSSLKTAIGLLRIDQVSAVPLSSIGEREARLAGHGDLEELKAELAARDGGAIYRIRFHFEGPDPRIKLSKDADLSPADIESLTAKLERYDKVGPYGPWTRRVMEAIRSKPQERAGSLAQSLGFPKEWLKTNIRKLKNLGLTVSLETGYELSPRGKRLLASKKR